MSASFPASTPTATRSSFPAITTTPSPRRSIRAAASSPTSSRTKAGRASPAGAAAPMLRVIMLLSTSGKEGPNITPKGSIIVFDDAHLAYWERSKRGVLENLGADGRVCVIYANFKAQRDGVLDSGFLRFFGTAVLHESGPVRDAIFAKLLPREQTH